MYRRGGCLGWMDMDAHLNPFAEPKIQPDQLFGGVKTTGNQNYSNINNSSSFQAEANGS